MAGGTVHSTSQRHRSSTQWQTRNSAVQAQPRDGVHLDVAVSPRGVFKALVAIIAVLVTVSVLGQLAIHALPDLPLKEQLATAFDVNAERSIPTAFSVVCLLAAAGLLAIIAYGARQRGHGDAGRWAALSLLFVALAADDYLTVHEQANEPVRAALGSSAAYLHWAWVLPGIVFVAVVALVFGRFLLRLPGATRRSMIAAAVLFLAGALGVEVLGGAVAASGGTDILLYEAAATVEETLEMLGTAVFLSALLRHIRDHLGGFSWRIQSACA